MRSLNDIMNFDHVIRVMPDGTVEDGPKGVYAPDLTMGYVDDDAHSITDEHEKDFVSQAKAEGWDILRGWTGQYAYHGICMHPSEYIGGALEEHVLDNPGLWVAITIEQYIEGQEQSECAGWTLAYKLDEDQ
jgi:hypothetical protein